MNYSKMKKITSVVLIAIGAIALLSEIATSTKNYYIQIVGVIALMLGVFMVNSKVNSKTKHVQDEYFEEE
ncbi:hypothetical protein [Aquimarina aggregata]